MTSSTKGPPPDDLFGCSEFRPHTYLFITFKQKKAISHPVDSSENSNTENEEQDDAVKTIYVSGIKDSTTTDAITYYFENKKRTGGGDLCEGKEGFKRLSPTVARLTFVSSKGIVFS